MRVYVVDQLEGARWEGISQFVRGQRAAGRASIEHDPRWLEVLRATMGQQPRALAAEEDDGAVRGYLPLALVRSRLFGRFLVSLPYLNRAGLVAADDRTAHELLSEAVNLAARERVQYLELRHGPSGIEHEAITHERTEKVRMVLELPGDGEALWQAVGSKVRNQVRKGEKSKLTIRWGGVELAADFYSVFAANMRDLGTPVYPRRLFEGIVERFAEEAELAVVAYEGAAVAGALLIHDPVARTTQVPSASCLRRFNVTNANMWMYHQLLLRAIGRGSGTFDFGRSSEGSGTWRFKKQWGAKPEPTRWQYHLRHGELGVMRPEHPKYRRRIAAWRKLPVWVTRMAGPMIVKGIP